MPQEMSITHDTSKYLRAMPIETEIASFAVVMALTMWVSHMLLGLCVVVSWVVPLVYLLFQPSAWAA
jgi:hypothetical protein